VIEGNHVWEGRVAQKKKRAKRCPKRYPVGWEVGLGRKWLPGRSSSMKKKVAKYASQSLLAPVALMGGVQDLKQTERGSSAKRKQQKLGKQNQV